MCGGVCNTSSISTIYLIAPSPVSPSLCPQELPGCPLWLLPSGIGCHANVLEISSPSGFPFAVPQQLSHARVLACPLVFLQQTFRKQRLLQLCGLEDLLALLCATCVGSELVSAPPSPLELEWGFGETRESCFGFSITQVGGCDP